MAPERLQFMMSTFFRLEKPDTFEKETLTGLLSCEFCEIFRVTNSDLNKFLGREIFRHFSRNHLIRTQNLSEN